MSHEYNETTDNAQQRRSGVRAREKGSAMDIRYRTRLGEAVCGNSLDVLGAIDEESVDLVVTSPPFALLRKKTYGNADQDGYVDWLCRFAPLVHRILKPTGSYVIDLGGAYRRGS